MTRRAFLQFQERKRPSNVQTMDTPGLGSSPKMAISYAAVPGSLELERIIFREVMDLVKYARHVKVVNADYTRPPSFFYYMDSSEKPFAVAVYAERSPTRYFVLMERVPSILRAEIKRISKGDNNAQDKLQSHPVPPRRGLKNRR